MKKPSPKTWQMLNEFHSSQGLWNSLTDRTPPIRFLEEIASSGETLAIPHLAPLLVHRSDLVRNATARCIVQLYTGIAPADIAQFEQLCRAYWSSESKALKPWTQLKPAQVGSFASYPIGEVFLGVASFHNNGYVRQAAVEALSASTNCGGVPFLLLRLNDWVPEVRTIAAGAVFRRLRPECASEFVLHLRLVLRLRVCGRGDRESLVPRIESLLKSRESLAAVLEGISSDDCWIRRESFRIAMEASAADRATLLERVVRDRDPILRLWAVKELLPRADKGELISKLETLALDRFRPVRCEALNLWASKFPADARTALERALFDTNGSVRAVAQYWMAELQPDRNLAATYREALRSVERGPPRVAVLGLGETGNAEDADLLSGYLSDPATSIQKAAIRSIAALNRDSYVENFLRALTDKQPGVSREGARALKPVARMLEEEVMSVFRGNFLRHVRRNAFLLLLSLSFWKRGILLFEAIRDFDDWIISGGRMALKNWMTRSRCMATPPTKDELRGLRNALKASSGMLRESEVGELEFLLRAFE